MNWNPLDYSKYADLVKFVIDNEWKSVSLSSRMVSPDGAIKSPRMIKERIFCLFNNNPEKISGVMLLSSSGLLLPMFLEDAELEAEEFRRTTKNILSAYRNIGCIIGLDRDVKAVADSINRPVRADIRYNLLSAGLPDGFPPEMDSTVVIQRAELKDAKKLYSIEEKYVMDEVLLDKRNLNRISVMTNLKYNCKNQILLFIEKDGVPVAKINTNAIGINYAQIGGVFTDYPYRRRGYSSILLRQLIFEASKLRKKGILFVKKSNTPANNLYLKSGFKKNGEYRIVYINY